MKQSLKDLCLENGILLVVGTLMILRRNMMSMRKDRLIYKDVREYMEEVAEEISMDKEKFIETAQRYLENNHEGADIDLEKLFKSFGKTEDNSHEIKFW
jgi:hypothetical protein